MTACYISDAETLNTQENDMRRKSPKTAKAMVMKTEFKMRVVGAKKGKGSYKRKGKFQGDWS